MAVVRGFILPVRPVQVERPIHRIVEPELDMHRLRPQQPAAISLFRELMRKLMPAGQWAVRSPMRSIAREIEEIWPSGEL